MHPLDLSQAAAYKDTPPMKLDFQQIGNGSTPVVILHGLLGSGQNWRTIAGRLSVPDRTIYLPDARNHGTSPHSVDHSYDDMAGDLVEFLDNREIKSAHVVGHSVGALAVMLSACQHPGRVRSLVSVDFAPRAYKSANRHVLDAMTEIDLEGVSTRQAVAQQLESKLKDRTLVMFVMTNLKQDESGGYRWRVNLPALLSFTHAMSQYEMPETSQYAGPSLFLRGDRSEYVREADEPLIRRHFPYSQIETIHSAGHWIHADQPDAVVTALSNFWRSSSS